MSSPAPRFVAIARTTYAQLPELPGAVADAVQLGKLLHTRHGYESVVLPELSRGELLDAIDAQLAPDSAAQGSLIIAWTGHGQLDEAHQLQLLGTAGGRDVTVAAAGQLAAWAARTGARQVLLLIDTCFAGGGLVDAVRVANAVVGERSEPEMAWFGAVAASLADEPARSGALARSLTRLLNDGPREPDMRWGRNRPTIRGDDLVQALLADWSEPRQTPFQISLGRASSLVRNPLYEAGLGDQPVEHLLRAARGSAGEESFFTGREQALARLVGSIGRGTPGMMVITGPAGCGKSALLGRILSLSTPAERARLCNAQPVPVELDPGEASVDAQLQAHGATVDSAAAGLARQIGVDPSLGRYGVLAAASQRRLAGRPLVIAIDGLDEARIDSRDLAMELLQPLAREAKVLVATREVPLGDTTLIALLSSAPGDEVLDLAEDPEATLRDVYQYVLRRLTGASPLMEPEQVADELTQSRDAASSATFLLARLITSQLREQPVDTAAPDWRLALARTVESALERDVQSVTLEIDGQAHPAAARELLRALAQAHGSGFPADDVWPAVASALSWSGVRYRREHVYALLTGLGRHIVASTQDEQPVYRIAHQQLLDYLAADALRDPARPAELNVLEAVGTAIADVYEQWLADGGAPQSHGYLWRIAWRHLAEAGRPGLARLERLAERDPLAFTRDLAAGYELASSLAWSEARAPEALTLSESAVALRRTLGDAQRLAMSLFQLALARSVVGDDDGAEQAADEAVEVARPLRDSPQGRVVLASAVMARAVTQLRDGHYRLARRIAEELIGLESEPSSDEDAWRRMSAACVIAAQAAMALDDLADAERLCRQAAELCDANDAAESEPTVFLDVQSTLATIQYLRAALAPADVNGKLPAASMDAGFRVLQEYEKAGPRGDFGDVLSAKGLLFLVRALLLNISRGLTDNDTNTLYELLEATIRLSRAHAAQIADAAVILGASLGLRAIMQASDGQAAAGESLNEVIVTLRRFAADSPMVGVELGISLDALTALDLRAFTAGELSDVQPVIDRQQEAVSLLRFSNAPFHRIALATALGRLGVMLLQTSSELSAAAREEAIEVLRGLGGTAPDVKVVLLANLIDQAAYLGENRLDEAAEVAREALQLAHQLPPNPGVTALLGMAEVNLASVLINLGQSDGTQDLLNNAIDRLRSAAGNPAIAGAMAAAYLILSLVDANAERFESALAHARDALQWFDSVGVPAFAKQANRMSARAAIGRAECATGASEQGTRTLREVIDELRVLAQQDAPGAARVVRMIELAAPDLWDDAIAALGDQPELIGRLKLTRRRPRHELALTVGALADALAGAAPSGQREVRAIARTHRSLAAEEFDRAWAEATGEVPGWLGVGSALEWAVIGWWNVPTWRLSRDYLAAHPVLLGPSTELLLEEFALGADDRDLVDRHLRLLNAARSQGVEAAYAPLMLKIEINAWLRDDDPEDYLLQHPELLRAEVLASLRERAADGDEVAEVFSAIFALAQRGEADLAFEAAGQPASMADQLRVALHSTDVSRLEALATIVFYITEDATKRHAAMALAIAGVLQYREESGLQIFRESISQADGDERVVLIEMVTDAIAHHTVVAVKLVALLAWLGGLE